MPNHKTHLSFGALIAYFIGSLILQYTPLSLPQIILGLGFCLLGSIFPDIDIASKMQKIGTQALFSVATYCFCFQQWQSLAIIFIFFIFIHLIRHRTITHNIFFIIFIACTTSSFIIFIHKTMQPELIRIYCLFFISGAWSHIILDKTTSFIKKHFYSKY